MNQVALAIAAHPDDIEFTMAGTLLLLKRAGWEIHYLNLSRGNCGSARHDAATTARLRLGEARAAAKILGAHFHPPFCNDLEIFYNLKTLRRLAAIVRAVNPAIVLTHSPQDYMEDHTNTCRLAVTAAFARGMPNFKTVPSRRAVAGDTLIYHGMPHGLRNNFGRRVTPEYFVGTASVHATKLAALAAHRSQQNWLEVSQGLNSYLQTLEEFSLELGRQSRKFRHAEGWRRHSHLGFGPPELDPLPAALQKNCRINTAYRRQREPA
jgi:LmbE family N-acetylglucosaminyl deacetylase